MPSGVIEGFADVFSAVSNDALYPQVRPRVAFGNCLPTSSITLLAMCAIV